MPESGESQSGHCEGRKLHEWEALSLAAGRAGSPVRI